LRRYRLRRLRLPAGATWLDLVVPDGQQWMRAGRWVGAAARGEEPPYWVEIWPASLAVARLLLRGPPLAGRRVLDLGCGLGVAGLAAAGAGAQVTFADRQADALAFAGWNGRRLHPEGQPPRCVLLDWNRAAVEGRHDVVVLADVTYRTVHHRPLLRQLSGCLAAGGVVVHADPFRGESGAFLAALRAMLATVEGEATVCSGDRRVRIRLVCASADRGALLPFGAGLSPSSGGGRARAGSGVSSVCSPGSNGTAAGGAGR